MIEVEDKTFEIGPELSTYKCCLTIECELTDNRRCEGSGFRMQGAGCRVQGAGCRVQGAGCRVQGAGCRMQGAGYRV